MTSDQQPVLMVRPDAGPPFAESRPWPVATLVILALTVLVYLLEIVAGGSTSPDVLLEFGAAYGPYIHRGEYWRLVMPIFLHAGLMHIALNGYAIYVLCPLLERIYGYGRFACLYIGAGIGASLVSMWRSNSIAVGASGAIFGVAAAMVVIGYRHPEVVPWRWQRFFGRRMIFLIAISLAFGPALYVANLVLKMDLPRIDNWAHVGGIATGAVLAFLVPPPPAREYAGLERPGTKQPSEAVVVVPIAVVALALASGVNHYRTTRAVGRLLAEADRAGAAGDVDRALERWQAAIRRAPNDERAYEELGLFYLEHNRPADAIREYSQAHRASPDSDEATLGLALAYGQSGEQAKSQELLDAVDRGSPPDAESQETLADLYAKYKVYAKAIEHYQRVIQRDPNVAVAHNNLAWLYATADDPRFRNPQQALEHARRAVALSSNKQPDFLDTLAEALYVNQNYDEAVSVETKALALAPDNAEFKDHLARYRKGAGV